MPTLLTHCSKLVLAWMALGLGVAALSQDVARAADGPTFSADMESGGVLLTDAPAAGPFERGSVCASCSITASPEAAHRGAYGLRIIDGNGASTPDYQAWVQRSFSPATGNFFGRAWFRLTSSNGRGLVILSQWFGVGGKDNLFEVWLALPGNLVYVGGVEAGSTYVTDRPFASTLADGSWHLLELGLYGVGTSAGARRIWVDGKPVYTRESLNFTGLALRLQELGEVYPNDGSFVGTLDFDDITMGTVEPAQQLQLTSDVPSPGAGECVTLQVHAYANDGKTAAPVPYDVQLELDLGGGKGSLFADSQCSLPVAKAILPKDASSASLFFKSDSPGPLTLQAVQSDFYSVPLSVVVSPQSPSPAASGGDGGATVPQGTQPHALGTIRASVQSGCSSGGDGAGLLAACALLLISCRARR